MIFYDKVRNDKSGNKVHLTFYNKVRNDKSGEKSSSDVLR